tara:strand:+ start:1009 stop:1422 length:414 start_codon:yes stop_codon:yes gene_type:complete
MNTKFLLSVLIFILISTSVKSQTCILDIGSKNVENITKAFQLNKEQVGALDSLRNQLIAERDLQEIKVKNLLETHPQSTPEELLILAKKHKELEDSMFETTIIYDQKLISLFNEKQYERYVLLCKSANRSPIAILED